MNLDIFNNGLFTIFFYLLLVFSAEPTPRLHRLFCLDLASFDLISMNDDVLLRLLDENPSAAVAHLVDKLCLAVNLNKGYTLVVLEKEGIRGES